MSPTLPPSIAALADRRVRESGDRPFLTFYDDATGERTELSYATFDNWACKTANLLSEEFDLGRGGDVAIALGSHWTAATVVFGCWRIGAQVVLDGEGAVTITEDYRNAVLAFGDDVEDTGAGLDDGALLAQDVRLSQRNLLAAADAMGAWGFGRDTRLLLVRTLCSVDALALGLLATFFVGGSVVLVRDPDPTTLWRKVRDERVTAALVDASSLGTLEGGLTHVLCPSGAGADVVRETEHRIGIGVAVGHGIVGATCASSLVPAEADQEVRAWLAGHTATTVGVATSRAEVAVVDGEIRIRGDVVTPDAGGWLHTGDHGFIENGPDGRDYVFVIGQPS